MEGHFLQLKALLVGLALDVLLVPGGDSLRLGAPLDLVEGHEAILATHVRRQGLSRVLHHELAVRLDVRLDGMLVEGLALESLESLDAVEGDFAAQRRPDRSQPRLDVALRPPVELATTIIIAVFKGVIAAKSPLMCWIFIDFLQNANLPIPRRLLQRG